MHTNRPSRVSTRFVLRFFLHLTLWLFILTSSTAAQQPTATITELTGSATVIIQGEERPAEIGLVLTETDEIVTQSQATAVLALSDGSSIQLREKTRLNLAVLLETPEDARQSRLKLLYGHIRAFLSPGHQQENSTFEMETPNAHVGIKFSQPQVDVEFEPQTVTTIVRTYTVCVQVRNLLTNAEIQQLCPGHQAIIREEFILVTKIAELSGIFNQLERFVDDQTLLTGQSGLADTGDGGALEDAYRATTENGPATSREDPEQGAESVGVSVTVDTP